MSVSHSKQHFQLLILSALIKVNYILMNTSDPGSGAINHSIEMHVLSPRRQKPRKPLQPNQPPTIIDQDVKCTPIKEEFNDYTAGKYITISVKAVVGQVAKMDAHSNEGEPIYSINVQPVIKVVDKRCQSFVSDMQ